MGHVESFVETINPKTVAWIAKDYGAMKPTKLQRALSFGMDDSWWADHFRVVFAAGLNPTNSLKNQTAQFAFLDYETYEAANFFTSMPITMFMEGPQGSRWNAWCARRADEIVRGIKFDMMGELEGLPVGNFHG